MREFTVPRVALGDDDNEMLLSAWSIEEGGAFDEGDPLLEVETDKAAMEVEADGPGVLALQLRAPGSRIAPGEVVAVVADPGEQYDREELRARYAASTASVDGEPAARESLAPEPTVPGPAAAPPEPEPVRSTAGDARPAVDAVPFAAAAGFDAPGLLYGLPARRRPRPAPVGASAGVGVRAPRAPVREPLSRHRRALAKLMAASAAIPQFSVHRELPMQEALRIVDALRRSGIAATLTDVLLRATALALLRHPELDGCFVDDAVEHAAEPAISLATDSPSGVVAPVVRGADRLPWRDLAQERKRVVDGARRGRLLPADLTGGTFSISNVGPLGGDLVVPMLTPPQIGILGVGRVRSAWGATVAGAALVADHRAVDGADAARFLASLAEILADPDALDGDRG